MMDPVSEGDAQLRRSYSDLRGEIEAKMDEFLGVWNSGEEEPVLLELLFCILTPQTRARTCWEAVEDLRCSDMILRGDREDVLRAVGKVRFKYRKASYIIEARERFTVGGRVRIRERIASFENPAEARRWLVKNIKGLGYKEASHFLRNIGLGEELTILDRHILKNLVRLKVIDSLPRNLTDGRYLEIEGAMKKYAKEIGIPVSHLDLLLWHRETGEIFK